MRKILVIIGARPQFIKHRPVSVELAKDFEVITIHTGQHYDDNMNAIFFDELNVGEPKYRLFLGADSHSKQTGRMMMSIEDIVLEEKPNAILVYGDTNSTLAGALVGGKLQVPIIHVEAGLRSYNKSMPEEINRVLTDYLAEVHFVPSPAAMANLKKEGIDQHVYVVGDVMLDILKSTLRQGLIKTDNRGDYYLLTLHRPYNVDQKERLSSILDAINQLSQKVIFTVHPRTEKMMEQFNLCPSSYQNIEFIPPASYLENIELLSNSKGLITDSGGMQKEAFWLQKKCVTIRPETEWVETLKHRWNVLVFDDLSSIESILKETPTDYEGDIYGVGDASVQIRKVLLDYFCI